MKHCATSITLRRSKLSASAPDGSDNSMIGSVVEACTSATMLAESEIGGHHPGGADALDQRSEIRRQAGDPYGSEDAVLKGRQR